MVRNPRPQRGRSGCKTKHCWGTVGRARCRYQKVVSNLYTSLRGSAAQTSWCIHHPAVCHGRISYSWNRVWEARWPDLAGKFARMGAGRLGGLNQLACSPPAAVCVKPTLEFSLLYMILVLKGCLYTCVPDDSKRLESMTTE